MFNLRRHFFRRINSQCIPSIALSFDVLEGPHACWRVRYHSHGCPTSDFMLRWLLKYKLVAVQLALWRFLCDSCHHLRSDFFPYRGHWNWRLLASSARAYRKFVLLFEILYFGKLLLWLCRGQLLHARIMDWYRRTLLVDSARLLSHAVAALTRRSEPAHI